MMISWSLWLFIGGEENEEEDVFYFFKGYILNDF